MLLLQYSIYMGTVVLVCNRTSPLNEQPVLGVHDSPPPSHGAVVHLPYRLYGRPSSHSVAQRAPTRDEGYLSPYLLLMC
ncbi:hypothetical protein BJX66DRAFT_290575 [Aspergillus keveii]|uniref:Secreted protein n=1 Tax=Aspergillus keveii TaxID=714993 RepID=A0ABR4GPG3_9EURO